MKCPSGARIEASAASGNLPLQCTAGSNRKERKPRFLHMFSGPSGRKDGLASSLNSLGCDCEEWDIVNGEAYDLADDATYQLLKQRISQGEFDGGLLGPPCHTVSNARRDSDGGPRPLRLSGDRDIYGRPGLSPEEKEDVRMGTLLALRAADTFMIFYELGKPVILEQPSRPEHGDAISMLNLPEFKRILKLGGVQHSKVAQCNYGAASEKPTSLMHFMVSFGDALSSCRHSKRWWRLPSTGAWMQAAHPPLSGKELYIPADQWRSSMMLSSEARRAKFRFAPYLTKAAAAYPGGLNEYFAHKLKGAHDNQPVEAKPWKLTGRWKNVLVRNEPDLQPSSEIKGSGVVPIISWTPALRGKQGQDDDESADVHLGGMRHPRRAMETIEGYDRIGKSIYHTLDRCLDSHPDLQRQCLEAIGSDDSAKTPNLEHIDEIRRELEALLDLDRQKPLERGLEYGMLGSWGRIAGDPDADFIEGWLRDGSPAGITDHVEDPGIFPQDDVRQGDDEGQSYFHDPAGHENYKSVEGDPMAVPEIQRLIDTGYVKVFDDLEACQEWLGGPPLTSKLAMVTKTRPDGAIKRRLIQYCRESGANLLARKGGRVQLPRPTDLVDDSLYLLSRSKGEEVEALVLDFKDWFYSVPLQHEERRYFTTAYREKAGGPLRYIVFLTQTQGGKNAPIVCGRVAVLIGRLSQSLFRADRARLQVYVDDPCFLMAGSQGQRDRMASILICLWMSLRIPLAFAQASRGADFTWIGVHYHIKADLDGKVTVTGKSELMQEILEATMAHQKVNVISVRDLQKYVGKANYVAGVVDTWRPFLTDLWAVINSCGPDSRPPNCVWTRQWAHVTAWFLAFYKGEAGTLIREYRVSHYFGRAIKMKIVTDASPWGIGGFLAMNNTPVAYFSDALCDFDLKLAEAERGSPGQQVWESLALLVALRLWSSQWVKRGVELHLGSGSVSALSLLIKLHAKPKAKGLGRIARELALDFSRCSYRPRWHEHIPGVSNIVSDILSRRFQPGKTFKLPTVLQQATEVKVPPRDHHFLLCESAACKAD